MKKIIYIFMFLVLVTVLASCGDDGYTIRFETNGGNEIDSIFVSDFNINSIPTPIKEGYQFEGWYLNEELTELLDDDFSPLNEITLYAKWTLIPVINTYTITFITNGGTIIDSLSVEEGSTISEPSEPVKEGFTFEGWYIDQSLTQIYSFTSLITSDTILYAKWEEIEIPLYTLTFNTNSDYPIEPIQYQENATLEPFITPEKTGYHFIGWFLSELHSSPANLTTMPNHDVTLYAKWEINLYHISFHTNGGTLINELDFEYNSEIILPSEPIKEGYVFVGWYLEEELINTFSEILMPANDLNLYAKWNVLEVSINFATEGGSQIASLSGVPGSLVTIPEDPIYQDHVFSGWYLIENPNELYIFDVFPNESITLYADWGTEGLYFELNTETQSYGVSIGDATDYQTITIPRFHEGLIVDTILDSGFMDAYELVTLHLPSTIKIISTRAFMDSTSLTYFEIPSSVESIGSIAFRNCHGINEFIVASENLYYESVDGILFSKDHTILIKYPQGKEGNSYTVPNHVLVIGEDAFSGAKNLHNINLGLGVTTIKTHAFYQTSYLVEIIIPDQVTTIELYAFRECVSLASVTLGAGLTSISSYMFDYCISLEEIVIPSHITSIGYGAFYDCTHLARVYILDDDAFSVIEGALFMFTNTAINLQIYFINQGIADVYKTSGYWVSYASKITVGSPE